MRRFMRMMMVWGFGIGGCLGAQAATPLGGLAVALSPKGDVLIAAGDNRVLYVLDAAGMAVAQRVWLGTGIVDLQFNKEGTFAFAEDTDGTIHQLDTATWATVRKLTKAAQMSVAPAAGIMAGLNDDYNGYVIRFLSMADLSELGKVTLPKGDRVVALGLDAAGQRLAVLCEPVDDPAEAKGPPPGNDLRGVALEEYRVNNDGRTMKYMLFNVADGAEVTARKLNFSPYSSGWKALFKGDRVVFVNYSNLNAEIAPDGTVTVFQLDNSYNYGIGFSANQEILLTGGLSDGTYTTVSDMSRTRFQPDRIGGWPEYFKGFTVAADGSAYGSTTAYRIIKIKAGGAFEKSVPVY